MFLLLLQSNWKGAELKLTIATLLLRRCLTCASLPLSVSASTDSWPNKSCSPWHLQCRHSLSSRPSFRHSCCRSFPLRSLSFLSHSYKNISLAQGEADPQGQNYLWKPFRPCWGRTCDLSLMERRLLTPQLPAQRAVKSNHFRSARIHWHGESIQLILQLMVPSAASICSVCFFTWGFFSLLLLA